MFKRLVLLHFSSSAAHFVNLNLKLNHELQALIKKKNKFQL